MIHSTKFALRETAVLALGETICAAIVCAVYCFLGRFQLSVLLGILAGLVLSLGNFFALAAVAALASDRAAARDPSAGRRLMALSYPIRLPALAAALFLCAGSGALDLIALVLPLLFIRPILFASDLFRKRRQHHGPAG